MSLILLIQHLITKLTVQKIIIAIIDNNVTVNINENNDSLMNNDTATNDGDVENHFKDSKRNSTGINKPLKFPK